MHLRVASASQVDGYAQTLDSIFRACFPIPLLVSCVTAKDVFVKCSLVQANFIVYLVYRLQAAFLLEPVSMSALRRLRSKQVLKHYRGNSATATTSARFTLAHEYLSAVDLGHRLLEPCFDVRTNAQTWAEATMAELQTAASRVNFEFDFVFDDDSAQSISSSVTDSSHSSNAIFSATAMVWTQHPVRCFSISPPQKVEPPLKIRTRCLPRGMDSEGIQRRDMLKRHYEATQLKLRKRFLDGNATQPSAFCPCKMSDKLCATCQVSFDKWQWDMETVCEGETC